MTVKINLENGIGNQLFTFCAGLWLADKLNVDLEIDLTGCQIDIQERKSSIRDLKILVSEKDVEVNWNKHNKSKKKILSERVIHKLAKRSKWSRLLMKQYRSLTYGFDYNLAELKSPIKVWGNFQTYYYYAELKKRKVIQNIEVQNPSYWYSKNLEYVKSHRPIVIHLRRGDYMQYTESLGVLSFDYYLNSFENLVVQGKKSVSKVLVFSDSQSAAQEFCLLFYKRFHLDVEILPPPSKEEGETYIAAEVLLLMSEGSALIGSNSSFSWWASVLGNQKDVVMPEPYFKNFPGLFEYHMPPEWKREKSVFLN